MLDTLQPMTSISAPAFRDVAAGFPRASAPPSRPSSLFPPRSVTRRLTAERALMLGGGRALLMQLAHPLVAAGVADHRDRQRLSWDRLWGTLDAVLSIVFGNQEQVSATGGRIGSLHREVTGDREGRPYRALDPDLLLWVHATLVDSATVTWECFVGPLARPARARHYQEMKAFAGVFGLAPQDLPASFDDFERYLSSTIAGLEVSSEAKVLAAEVLRPPAPPVLLPALALHRLVTVGLLPETIREGFELPWSPARERSFRLAAATIRGFLPMLPRSVRRWPHAAWVP